MLITHWKIIIPPSVAQQLLFSFICLSARPALELWEKNNRHCPLWSRCPVVILQVRGQIHYTKQVLTLSWPQLPTRYMARVSQGWGNGTWALWTLKCMKEGRLSEQPEFWLKDSCCRPISNNLIEERNEPFSCPQSIREVCKAVAVSELCFVQIVTQIVMWGIKPLVSSCRWICRKPLTPQFQLSSSFLDGSHSNQVPGCKVFAFFWRCSWLLSSNYVGIRPPQNLGDLPHQNVMVKLKHPTEMWLHAKFPLYSASFTEAP